MTDENCKHLDEDYLCWNPDNAEQERPVSPCRYEKHQRECLFYEEEE